MPELPEVETVRAGLAPYMVGVRVLRVETRRADLRFAFPPRFRERLGGRRVESLDRRAKYLLARLDGAETLVMHLGMSGSFRVEGGGEARSPGAFHHGRGEPGPHDHVVLAMSGGASIIYNDPRRFGFMTLIADADLASHPWFAGLGVEPLGDELDGALLARLFAGRTAPLKAALLDQRLVAGLGNIYACEALHRARLSPRRAAGTIARKGGQPTPRAGALATAIREVLGEALVAGGSTLRDHRRPDGELGYFQHRFRVYDREGAPCPTPGCGALVRRLTQSGRSTFYCGSCQK